MKETVDLQQITVEDIIVENDPLIQSLPTSSGPMRDPGHGEVDPE